MATAFFWPTRTTRRLPRRHPGVEKIALQHWVVLREDRDDHCRIFRPLALVDGRGIGRNQNVELAEFISDTVSG